MRKAVWPFVSFALVFVCFSQSAQGYEVAKRYAQEVKVAKHYRIAFADGALSQEFDALLQVVVGDFNALPCGPTLEIVAVENADILVQKGTLPEGFAAHTKRNLRGRRVEGALIVLNSEFAFSESFPQEMLTWSLGGVLRHEIGHALGLEHSRKPGALMHSASLKNGNQKRFAFDDLMAFCHLYQD